MIKKSGLIGCLSLLAVCASPATIAATYGQGQHLTPGFRVLFLMKRCC
ncbi:hypothetical protein B6N26_04947 (plasmid) [Salmonella enterica subsp. enterica]|nr:hypothetical protein B6N26_04947 [Salmonella enterica subsp. enterica]